jgi:hypothetical protein
MCFDFGRYIFGNYLFQLAIVLVDFLLPMMDKRNKVGGVAHAYDHAGAVLGMLQSCADA